jgi:hypothetical protein
MITAERPEVHYATDRRCYNGALSTDLRKEVESTRNLRIQIEAVEPEFDTCYFPMEGKYSGWVGNKQITDMHEDIGHVLLVAWNKLVGSSRY